MLRLTTFFSYDASSALGPHRRHRHLQMISAFRKACLKILSCRSKNTPLKTNGTILVGVLYTFFLAVSEAEDMRFSRGVVAFISLIISGFWGDDS